MPLMVDMSLLRLELMTKLFSDLVTAWFMDISRGTFWTTPVPTDAVARTDEAVSSTSESATTVSSVEHEDDTTTAKEK